MGASKDVGCGCAVASLAMVGFVILLAVLGVCFLGGRLASTAEKMLDGDDGEYGVDKPECDKTFNKKWMCGDGDEDDPEVVYIPMRGVIAATELDEGLFADSVSDYANALRSIRAATRDRDVRGICLMLDTPGGTVTDSDVMADALRRFRAAGKDRFVLVLMGSMCCSGGYYVAAEADYVMAHPTTMTGSIGVIMSGYNAAELAKKIGVKSVVIASGDNKALLDPFEPVNPEHVKILKRPVEQDYDRFLSIVAKGRKLPKDKVRPLADGRILSAQDAKDAGLVDGLGYAEDAWEKAAELAKSKNVRIYRYEEPFSWRQLFSPQTFMQCGRAFAGGVMSEAERATPRNEYKAR